jgi:hypothetical protein
MASCWLCMTWHAMFIRSNYIGSMIQSILQAKGVKYRIHSWQVQEPGAAHTWQHPSFKIPNKNGTENWNLIQVLPSAVWNIFPLTVQHAYTGQYAFDKRLIHVRAFPVIICKLLWGTKCPIICTNTRTHLVERVFKWGIPLVFYTIEICSVNHNKRWIR